jgi:hypothetical protein
VADAIKVDAEGLQSHAQVCDASASALSAIAAPTAAGHITQPSTSAVAVGHALVDTVTGHLATRATSFGYKLRVASGAYVTTDEDSGQAISATVEV